MTNKIIKLISLFLLLNRMEFVKIKCDGCKHTNKIPVSKFYDGFEGLFLCDRCKNVLDDLHIALDEGED